jgi:hypothetical protein
VRCYVENLGHSKFISRKGAMFAKM